MRARHGFLGIATLALLWACDDSAVPEAEAADAAPPGAREVDGDRKVMTPGPSPGGSTGDFSGRCSCETTESELALDEPHEALGFTGQDALARIAGEYALPMVWGDSCEDSDGSRPGCDAELPAFAGSETELRLAIALASTASSARIEDCDGGEDCRLVELSLPLAGTLSSADGLLDETFSLEAFTRSLELVSVHGRSSAGQVNGALRDEVDGLAGIDWGLGVSDTQVIFELHVLAGGGHARLVSRAPEGGMMPAGHSWGVALDLEDARR